MIPVMIIDDERHGRDIISEYLSAHPSFKVIAEAADGYEALKSIRECTPELLFLDIQMPRINGFELLELLDNPPSVIFTTAYDQYAIQAFEANAVDYLLKPFSRERFDQAVQKWLIRRQHTVPPGMDWNKVGFGRHPDRIVVKSGHKIEVIPLHDIFCLEAADDYVRIHAQQGIFLKKSTMGGYVAQMEGKQFVRVHRSWMIAMTALKRIDLHDPDGTMAILANGLKVPVSRQGYAKLKVLLDL